MDRSLIIIEPQITAKMKPIFISVQSIVKTAINRHRQINFTPTTDELKQAWDLYNLRLDDLQDSSLFLLAPPEQLFLFSVDV